MTNDNPAQQSSGLPTVEVVSVYINRMQFRRSAFEVCAAFDGNSGTVKHGNKWLEWLGHNEARAAALEYAHSLQREGFEVSLHDGAERIELGHEVQS